MANNPPNVVWITLDSLKATALPFYGNPHVHAPNLSRLAAEGVVFDHAFAQMPKCVPSRVSMISGRYPHADGLRVNRGRLDVAFNNAATSLRRTDDCHLVALLKQRGCRTCLKGPNHMLAAAGHDRWIDAPQQGGAQRKLAPELLGPVELRMQYGGAPPAAWRPLLVTMAAAMAGTSFACRAGLRMLTMTSSPTVGQGWLVTLT